MRPVCGGFCEGVEAGEECGHACLDGYEGGMVRCVCEGARCDWEVTPCYAACANWEGAEAEAVWAEMHMAPLAGAERRAVGGVTTEAIGGTTHSCVTLPAPVEGAPRTPGVQTGARVQLRDRRKSSLVQSIDLAARFVTLQADPPCREAVDTACPSDWSHEGRRARLIDNDEGAQPRRCDATPRHSILTLDARDGRKLYYVGDLESVGAEPQSNCKLEWLDYFETCAAELKYRDLPVYRVDNAVDGTTVVFAAGVPALTAADVDGCELVSEACAAGDTDCVHTCESGWHGGVASCSRTVAGGAGGDLALLSCNAAHPLVV